MDVRRAGIGAVTLALAAGLALGPVALASATTKHKGHHKATTTTSGTCPTAAEINAATGLNLPTPQSSSSSGLVTCNYNNPTTGANVVVAVGPSHGITPAELKKVADSSAQAEGVSATALSGYGQVAYLTTLDDASTNSDGVATSIIEMVAGSHFYDITAEATPTQVEAIAHYLLAH